LPNIEDINGVSIANVNAFSGVTLSGNEVIDGVTAPLKAPAAAYSVRLLDSSVGISSYTGPAMRIRRFTGVGNTGNDDEADVRFDTGLATPTISLDSAISNTTSSASTLGEFLNVGTVSPYNGGLAFNDPDNLVNTAEAYVDTWYDQSGNAKHALQSTPGSQPQIHSGMVNTDLITENGKPNLLWSDDQLTFSSSLVSNPMAIFHVKDVPNNQYFLRDGTTAYVWPYLFGNQVRTAFGGALNIDSITPSNVQSLLTFIKEGVTGVSSVHFLNGVDQSTPGYTDLDTEIGTFTSLGFYSGNAQEFIFYDSDQSSNRPGIEENINSEYLIYQPTDAPTSGLLATYTGAAAAYSVRQLADTAVIAITVRRDSDDEEKRFGFDSNGDLDSTGIAAFCTTANGYVSQWWDQSTNGNHATQSTSGNQPQIYNGTAVITENGKPAPTFDGTNALNLSVTGTATDLSAFLVRGFATYPTSYQNAFHYKTRGIGYNANGGSQYANAHLVSNALTKVMSAYPTTTGQALDYFLNQSEMYRNSTSQTLGTGGNYGANSTSVIGGWQETSQNMTGTIQELVLYESDQSTNRTGIETNINTYFSIY
jgi:hypothetical protein